jgi:hypothetical protein
MVSFRSRSDKGFNGRTKSLIMYCELSPVEYVAIAMIKADEYIAPDSMNKAMTGKSEDWS